MNVYDFDGTIYEGDSSIDFYFFCLKKYPHIIAYLPTQAFWFMLMLLHLCSKERAKSAFFRFVGGLPDVKQVVHKFWLEHRKKVRTWYYKQCSEDDVIISASPDFLLRPLSKELKVDLIATNVDSETGSIMGNNCYGKEKVRRFREVYPDARVEQFYTDSLSDMPMANIADQYFIV